MGPCTHAPSGDVKVSAIGLGGMPMSIEGRPDRERSLATIHAALDAGVTLIDTADAYHLHADEVGHNESLIAEACARGAATRPTCSSPRRAVTCAPATARGPWTVPRSTSGRRSRTRSSGSASTRSASTSSTAPTRASRTPSRSACSRELLDDGKIRLAGISNAEPGRRSGWRRRCSAAGSSRCRTSTRPPSARRSRSSTCAPSSVWPSCRGARSAGSPGPAELGSRFERVRERRDATTT